MSDIRFHCPSCRAKLSIDSGSVDMVVDCPECHKPILAWGAPLLEIRFHCPTCKTKLLVDAGLPGREIACPSCQATITVPTPATAAPIAGAEAKDGSGPRSLITEAEIRFLSKPDDAQGGA